VRVLMLPGAVLPAHLAYAALLKALSPQVRAVTKDLEVYRDDQPPEDYSLEDEVNDVSAVADRLGWERFHLAGYSAGGSVALAFTARHPSRVVSLSLLEPAWAGSWDWSAGHRGLWAQYDALLHLSSAELIAAFMRLQVQPGVALPAAPVGDAPSWMSRRPAGIRALLRSFGSYDLDRAALSRFMSPVYFALGGRSNPDQFAEEAERLRRVFADFTLEVFGDRHHFDPPHRVEPTRLARSLSRTWARGETSAP
jgi:pimeloyl-ACP methyl ester carboxylesterase